ncbi:MAG: caspase family protein [Pseudomonadota bacterium]
MDVVDITTRAFGLPKETVGFKANHALIIGINDYQHGIPPLKTAVNDATRLAQVLEQAYDYQVQLLTEDITLENLKLALDTLKQTTTADDRVVFYFAGHGIALDGEDGPAGYIVPEDARQADRNSFLPMALLHDDFLKVLNCRHLLAIFDCCFAGAFRWASMRSIADMPEVIHQERYLHYISDPARQILTSSAHDQKALDVADGMTLGMRDEQQSHSPFALALFKALEEGAGDIVPDGGDGLITATELYLYLRTQVESYSDNLNLRQTPGLWPLSGHDKGEYLFELPNYQFDKLQPAPEPNIENNPYRGLLSYEAEDSELFFGRTMQIETLVSQVQNSPLTVVLGASGTGKSSLVKAGVIPQLTLSDSTTEEDRTPNWSMLPPLRPGEHPGSALRTLLSEHLLPQDDSASLERWLEDWQNQHPDQCLLLLIDQMEELVTLCRDDKERQEFADMLQALWHHPNAHLILTLRNDFEPQLSIYFPAEEWQAARFFITPMTQDELREVIEGPASVQVLYFDPPDLVDTLINEVVQTPGALPRSTLA